MRQDVASMLSAGLAALDAGDFAAAQHHLRQLVTAAPAEPEGWNALAWACVRSGQADLAVQYAGEACRLARRRPDFLNTLGVAHGETGALAQAEETFRKALKVQPAHVDALVNLAKTLEKEDRLDEAAPVYSRALALKPDHPKVAGSLATLHLRAGRTAQARTIIDRFGMSMDGQDRVLLQAWLATEEDDFAAGRELLAGASREHPDWTLARYSLALGCLAAGEWAQGWEAYLARPAAAGRDAPPPRLPPRLEGRRILLRGEQGIGDVLFFLRFEPLLRARGAIVRLACEEKLRAVLPPDLARDEGPGDEALLVGDLPWSLDARGVAPPFALSVDREEERAARTRLAALGEGPYLGVTWRAGTDVARAAEFGGDRGSLAKAIPPGAIGAALRGWRGTVVLLQRGARPEDAAQFSAALGAKAHDLSFLGEDLRALLGVLAVLDEYVGVSSTNMHMVAGLGRTARVLVPRPPEWRWMLEGGESPWFPGFPLYRQGASRDWSEPLARLRKDLLDG